MSIRDIHRLHNLEKKKSGTDRETFKRESIRKTKKTESRQRVS